MFGPGGVIINFFTQTSLSLAILHFEYASISSKSSRLDIRSNKLKLNLLLVFLLVILVFYYSLFNFEYSNATQWNKMSKIVQTAGVALCQR